MTKDMRSIYTCDDSVNNPCPVHEREIKLQNEVIRLKEQLKTLANQVIDDINGIEREFFNPKGEQIADWSSLAVTRRWARDILISMM